MPSLSGNDVKITIKIEGQTDQLSETEKKISEFNKKMDEFGKLGKKFTDIGKDMTTKVTLPIVAAGTAIVYTGAQFDKNIQTMKALGKAGGLAAEELEKIGEVALKASERGLFSAQQISDAMVDMVRDGMTPAQIEAGHLDAVMNLAAATGESLANSQIALSDTMQAFGLETKDASRIVDIFVNTLNATPGELADFQESMKYSAPVAAQFGQKVEGLSAAVGTLAEIGIRGSMAGTGLAQAMTSLYAPTDKAAEVMEEIGLKAYDAQGNAKEFDVVLGDLTKVMEGATEEQKNFLLNTIFTTNGMRVIAPLIGENADRYAELRKEIGKTGTAQATADEMTKGLSGALNQLRNAVNSLMIRMTSANSGPLISFVNALTSIVNALGKLPPGVMQAVAMIAVLVAAIGPLLIVVGQTLIAIKTIGTAIAAVNVAMTASLPVVAAFILAWGPILLIVAGVAALTAAVGYLLIKSDLLKTQQELVSIATDRLKMAQDNLRISLDAVRDAEDRVRGAMVSQEGAALRVERAQLNYNEALKKYGPTALETREAENQLEQAKLDSEQATKQVNQAVDDNIVKYQEYNEKAKEVEEAQKKLDEANARSETVWGKIRNAVQGAVDAISNWINKNREAAQQGGGGGSWGGRAYSGTNYSNAGQYLVGEQGPEIVTLPRGSKVTPNHQAGIGGGEVSVTNNIYNQIDMDKTMRELSWRLARA